ncbi:MAG: DUF3237 domain-containing protein [Clostridiales bacterium]|nr:DUF3237 domain-containing protein [Clostridiales bacterium]
MNLEAKEILRLHVVCEKEMEVKEDGRGYLRVIPIVRGTFEGLLRGTIVPGGADWNTSYNEGKAHVFAKYLLLTDDGNYIAIENEGKIDFTKESRIKTVPRFQVSNDSPYAWLNTGVYVGELNGGDEPGQVEITIYQLS